jgi:hypothetical protein
MRVGVRGFAAALHRATRFGSGLVAMSVGRLEAIARALRRATRFGPPLVEMRAGIRGFAAALHGAGRFGADLVAMSAGVGGLGQATTGATRFGPPLVEMRAGIRGFARAIRRAEPFDPGFVERVPTILMSSELFCGARDSTFERAHVEMTRAVQPFGLRVGLGHPGDLSHPRVR